MKRILCTSIVLMMLLSACSTPVQKLPPSTGPGESYTYGVYQFTFEIERLSGWSFAGWDFSYTYNGAQIQSGHQLLFSEELFSFHCVQVDVIERDNPGNSYSATFPVAICDGGSRKTEITVTDSHGHTVTFEIICRVTQAGTRKSKKHLKTDAVFFKKLL